MKRKPASSRKSSSEMGVIVLVAVTIRGAADALMKCISRRIIWFTASEKATPPGSVRRSSFFCVTINGAPFSGSSVSVKGLPLERRELLDRVVDGVHDEMVRGFAKRVVDAADVQRREVAEPHHDTLRVLDARRDRR